MYSSNLDTILLCRKTARHMYWKYAVPNTFCSQMCSVLPFVFPFFFLCYNGRRFWIKMEQCVIINFFVCKGISPKETIDELCNVNTEDKLLLAPTIYWWCKVYEEGRQRSILQKLSGQLVSQITLSYVNTISVMIRKDCYLLKIWSTWWTFPS